MFSKDNFSDMFNIGSDFNELETSSSDNWEVTDDDGDTVELGY